MKSILALLSLFSISLFVQTQEALQKIREVYLLVCKSFRFLETTFAQDAVYVEHFTDESLLSKATFTVQEGKRVGGFLLYDNSKRLIAKGSFE